MIEDVRFRAITATRSQVGQFVAELHLNVIEDGMSRRQIITLDEEDLVRILAQSSTALAKFHKLVV